MSRVGLATALALVALVAAAAGCGGGSSANSTDGTESSSAQSPPLSSAAFVKKADEICTESQKRIETEFAAIIKKNKEASKTGETPQDAEALGIEAIETVGIPQLGRQVRELRELEAPASKKTKFDAYLSALEEEIEDGEKNPEALSGTAKKVFAGSDAAAKGIGFKVCAVHS